MKNNYLLALGIFFLTANTLRAQSWFDNNPQWVNYFTFGFAGGGFEYVSVAGDTVLQGKTAKILKRFRDMNSVPDNTDFRVARQSGDTIWCWNHTQNQFFVNYNFSLAPGDSVEVPFYWNNNGAFKYTVATTGSVFIGGQSRRFQLVDISTGYNALKCSALIVENIGMLNGQCTNSDNNNLTYTEGHHFFLDEPNLGATDGPDWFLCRFEDDKGEYAVAGGICDPLTGTGDAPESHAVFSIAPNPFGDQISVMTPEGEAASLVRVFDCYGRLVKSVSRPAKGIVRTDDLLSGLYFIEVVSVRQQRSLLKAVKY